MTRIKFCGMKRPEDAREAEALGAAFIGVILMSSPRQVSVKEAISVFEMAPSLRRVGVIGRDRLGEASQIARELDLDVIQLHGAATRDEVARIRDEFEGEIWSVVPVDSTTGLVDPNWRNAADLSDAILVDTRAAGKTGGTGKPFAWSLAQPVIRDISRELPVVLAGGLRPENVGEAVQILRPSIVDVSSGIESAAGVKDHARMRAFANAVLSASIV